MNPGPNGIGQETEWRGRPADAEVPRSPSTLSITDRSVRGRLTLAFAAIPLVAVGYWYDFRQVLLSFIIGAAGVPLLILILRRS